MTDAAITVRNPRLAVGPLVLEDYSNGAITAGSNKREWIIPFNAIIEDVICDAGAANSGDDDIIDVNLNGTTIYTTQGNRPTLTDGDTGMFAEAGEPEVRSVNAGDVISYDIDQVGSGAGCTRFKIMIILRPQ